MFSKPVFKLPCNGMLLGVLVAITLYSLASFAILYYIQVDTSSGRPIVQHLDNLRTFKLPDAVLLRFTSTTVSDENRILYSVTKLTNVDTTEVIHLPMTAIIVDSGKVVSQTAVYLPMLPAGVYSYERAFTYHPKWSFSEREVRQETLKFKVCSQSSECKA